MESTDKVKRSKIVKGSPEAVEWGRKMKEAKALKKLEKEKNKST